MIFNSRKNLELKDNYIGGCRDFEIKSDKNEYINVFDETYGCWSDCFAVELSVYDFSDKTYNNSLHICHCCLEWDNYYIDSQGYSGGYDNVRTPPSGQMCCSEAYYGDIIDIKKTCRALIDRAEWSFSDVDFLTFKRAILASFADFCAVYYK